MYNFSWFTVKIAKSTKEFFPELNFPFFCLNYIVKQYFFSSFLLCQNSSFLPVRYTQTNKTNLNVSFFCSFFFIFSTLFTFNMFWKTDLHIVVLFFNLFLDTNFRCHDYTLQLQRLSQNERKSVGFWLSSHTYTREFKGRSLLQRILAWLGKNRSV